MLQFARQLLYGKNDQCQHEYSWSRSVSGRQATDDISQTRKSGLSHTMEASIS